MAASESGAWTLVGRWPLLLGPVVLAAAGCDALLPELPDEADVLDAPLDGLTTDQLAVHLAGDEQFGRRFSVAEGLGPIFNSASCDQCHVGEGKGHLVFNLARFGRMTGGGFDPMRAVGGPQLQNRAIPGFRPESRPDGVTGVAEFMPPSVTGLGFLEAVDDATLLALQDPDDADGDGISGRVQVLEASTALVEFADLEALAATGPPGRGTRVEGGFIGRFGRKAGTINLLHQTATAYHQDMGLTTDRLPRDLLAVATGNFAEDGVADPEVTSAELNAVVFYLKTLRQPLRRNATDPEVEAGEVLFDAVGCTGCHLPELT
ncbi:MAG TPA: di-heme oxidoredictase family protein, partial [Longimicrobiales bacterium]|nr:di-heme oxidoredictase family protein [Longimicrobiales bacterium]